MVLVNRSGLGLAVLIDPYPTSEIWVSGRFFVFILCGAQADHRALATWVLFYFYFLLLVDWLVLLCVSETTSAQEKYPSPIVSTFCRAIWLDRSLICVGPVHWKHPHKGEFLTLWNTTTTTRGLYSFIRPVKLSHVAEMLWLELFPKVLGDTFQMFIPTKF